jgi:hypothetical protein
MRVRTGQFEQLRSAKPRHTESVEVGSGHEPVQGKLAVVPPATSIARHLRSVIPVREAAGAANVDRVASLKGL